MTFACILKSSNTIVLNKKTIEDFSIVGFNVFFLFEKVFLGEIIANISIFFSEIWVYDNLKMLMY